MARALRYPDISVVIDLSQATHSEKVNYLERAPANGGGIAAEHRAAALDRGG